MTPPLNHAAGATAGPWTVEDQTNSNDADAFGIHDTEGWIIADVWKDIKEENEAEALANAHLIAAAPDLYAALQGMVAAMERPSLQPFFLDAQRDALSAARAALSTASAASQGDQP